MAQKHATMLNICFVTQIHANIFRHRQRFNFILYNINTAAATTPSSSSSSLVE